MRDTIKILPQRGCSCCNQNLIVGKSLSQFYVQVLEFLAEQTPGVPVHLGSSDLPREARRDGSYAWLRYWGLINMEPKPEEKKKSGSHGLTGFWTITEKGRAFLRGEIDVWSRVQKVKGNLLPTDSPADFTEWVEMTNKDGEEPEERERYWLYFSGYLATVENIRSTVIVKVGDQTNGLETEQV